MAQKPAPKKQPARLLSTKKVKNQSFVELFSHSSHLSALLDGLKINIYICSSEYLLEYMSQSMIERLGRDATGETCYKALHGFDSTCPWCEADRVFLGETVSGEFQNPVNNN